AAHRRSGAAEPGQEAAARDLPPAQVGDRGCGHRGERPGRSASRRVRAPRGRAPGAAAAVPEEGVMIARGARLLAVSLLRIYRILLSPILPPACRFVPSCSEFALGA